MSKEIGITKGKCEIDKHDLDIVVNKNHRIDFWTFGETTKETSENAKLFCEAMNVSNQSNRTPRQLLEERDRLLELVKESISLMDNVLRSAEENSKVMRLPIGFTASKFEREIKDIES